MRPRSDGTAPARPNHRSLTDLYVRRFKPTDRVVHVYDTKQRGLVLQVQPTGLRSWKCYYSRHGNPRWMTIGRADAISLADARKLAARIMLKVAEGEDPQANRAAERIEGTFKQM